MNPEPIVKTLQLTCTPEKAFHSFTEEIGKWWPLATHSLAGNKHSICAFEPEVGGRLCETDNEGTEYEWGRVTAWDPPTRLAFTWRVGEASNSEQHVEVTFSPTSSGTEVRLVHGGWTDSTNWDGYQSGWDTVLSGFLDRVRV